MRFERLSLHRFGQFADREIEFAASTPSFHVIVGANEAGKSTLRAAISDLLFGFDLRSPWAFRFDTTELELRGAVRHAGQSLEFIRLKRRTGTLRRPDGSELPDAVLDAWLGGITRSSYGSMYSLGHEELRSGGRRLLDSSDDAGRQLFEASSGLAGLSRLKQALDEEADSIWTNRKNISKTWYAANDLFEKAEREKKASTVTTTKYGEAQTTVAEAESNLKAAREHLERLRVRQAQLNRIRRVAPLIAERMELRNTRDALGHTVPFPSDVGEQTRNAKQRLSEAREKFSRQSSRKQSAHSQSERAVVDPAYEQHSEDVRALQEAALARSTMPGDLLKRRGELTTQQADLARKAKELGWPADDIAGLRERVPSSATRAEMAGLIERHTKLSTRLEAAEREFRLANKSLERCQQRLDEARRPEELVGLRSVIAAVEARRDLVQQADTLTIRIAESEAQQSAQISQLSPWTGSIEDLRAFSHPDSEKLDWFDVKFQSCLVEMGKASDRVSALEKNLAMRNQRFDALRADKQLVSQEEVATSRSSRDGLWKEFRDGTRTLAADGDEYEHRVQSADGLVDQRLAHASEAAELDSVTADITNFSRDLTEARRHLSDIESQQQDLKQQWATAIAPLPGSVSTTRFRAWLALRDQLLTAATGVESMRASRDAVQGEIDILINQLAAAISEARPVLVPDAGIHGLLTQARDVVAENDRRRDQYGVLETAVGTAAGQSALRSDDVNEAETLLREWEAEWVRATSKANLSGMSVEQAKVALGQVVEVANVLDRIEGIQTRITAMEAQIDLVEHEAARLSNVFPRHDGEQSFAYAARLAKALAENEQAASTRRSAIQELQAAEEAIDSARREIAAVEGSISPLRDMAGAQSFEELEIQVERWARLQTLETNLADIERKILAGSDGLSLETLISEVSDLSPDQVVAEVQALETDISNAMDVVQKLAVRAQQATDEVDRIGVSSSASDAEFARQQALARLTDATERYLNVRSAERLLHWSVEKFRAEKQGPLLARANGFFERLTVGRFDRLVVDADSGPAVLKARRRDGRYVTVEGMSDGTVDQLYLALRLASVHLHLDHARPLPFIADDLIVNFDEERGAAALQALLELAARTQVIFLTHHEFVADQARGIVGPSLDVIRLLGEPVTDSA